MNITNNVLIIVYYGQRVYIFPMKFIPKILIILLVLFYGCDQGLSPSSAEDTQGTGFSGTITFEGNWPQGITRTHLIVFKDPINSAADFNISNLSYISYEIPYGTKTFNYNTVTDSSYIPIGAGEYSYIIVAQEKTPVVTFNRADWTVVGVYYAGGDTTQPGKIIIPSGTLIPNINIKCNFNLPPPQPPGGN